jgi:sigma-B regulation protein RsbU (phosphoserine phosphatase)
MRPSLSFKLALLLAVSLSCVVIPGLAIINEEIGESALRADKQSFLSTLRVIDENIFSGFLRLNAFKIASIVRGKERLRTAARDYIHLLSLRSERGGEALSGIVNRLLQRQEQEHEAQRITVVHFSLSALESAAPLGLTPETQGLKGRSLREILSKLPSSGDYDIYRLEGGEPRLAHFLPAGQGVVASAISMRQLESEVEEEEQRLIRYIAERLDALPPHRGGFAALADDRGVVLAGRLEDAAGLHPLLRAARERGLTQAVLPLSTAGGGTEEMLVLVNFSRPFKWFTIIAAPMREISAPSRALLFKLILQSLGIGLAVLATALLLLSRVVRPLRLMLQKIRALPDLDFSSGEAGRILARDLPLGRGDEVGELARSFAVMGEKLSGNVRALMESTKARERMQGELDAGHDIQQGILPAPALAPNMPGLSSSALMEPARETGGDLYDFFALPDGRLAFMVGDVSGKGVPAALFMAITTTIARFSISLEAGPGQALDRINNLLQENNPNTLFVTLFLALYDPATGRLEYANAGHNPPLLAGARGADFHIGRLEGKSGPVAGIMADIGYASFSHNLAPGELCLLYTDGVTETIDEKGTFYEEERLMDYLRRHGGERPQELLRGIFADVRRFRGEAAPFDDITMLAFARR